MLTVEAVVFSAMVGEKIYAKFMKRDWRSLVIKVKMLVY